ncbi:MAG: hypothetical protein J07HX5_00544 [halophilic archaeon J07HX5]|nr:MAG: hypothetical protein J07HX5_00544 [halophilic archaeon J07HX5]
MSGLDARASKIYSAPLSRPSSTRNCLNSANSSTAPDCSRSKWSFGDSITTESVKFITTSSGMLNEDNIDGKLPPVDLLLVRGNAASGSASRTATSYPRAAMSRAACAPAGPAPAIATSYCCCI